MKAIIELQKRAMGSSTDIIELVRSAYMIAFKLELQGFTEWCNAELEGYIDHSNVPLPKYRILNGAVMISHSGGIRKPVEWSDIEQAQRFQQILNGEALSTMMNEFCDKDGWTDVRLNPKFEQSLRNFHEENSFMVGMSLFLSVHYSQIKKVFNTVQKKILDWALECEKQGILGEEWEFTKEEKVMAQTINYNISGSGNNIATHNKDTTIHQTAQNMSIIKGDFESLAKFLNSQGIREQDIEELKDIIDSEPNIAIEGIENNKIKGWLGNIAIKMIDGTLAVAKGVTIATIVDVLKQFF